MMNCTTVTTTCEFKTTVLGKGEDKRIFLKANSKKFIEETFRLLAEYSQKISPNTVLSSRNAAKITKCDSGPFKFKAEIHDVLPRHVRNFFGDFENGKPSYYLFNGANCHGTSLVAAGLFPVPVYMESTPNSAPFCYNLQKVPLIDVDIGDIVLLGNGDHTFVYLSHSLCLSMNGINKPFNLYRTEDVLKLYKFSKDSLINPPFFKKIVVYRRKEHETWMDEIPQSLINLFLYQKGEKNHPFYLQSLDRPAFTALWIHGTTSQNTTQLSATSSASIEYFHGLCEGNLKDKLVENPEDELAARKSFFARKMCGTSAGITIAALFLTIWVLRLQLSVMRHSRQWKEI